MSRKEPREGKDKKQDGELSDAELEQAEGGQRAKRSESPESGGKNRACFRMLEEDFLFRRLERKGWRR